MFYVRQPSLWRRHVLLFHQRPGWIHTHTGVYHRPMRDVSYLGIPWHMFCDFQYSIYTLLHLLLITPPLPEELPDWEGNLLESMLPICGICVILNLLSFFLSLCHYHMVYVLSFKIVYRPRGGQSNSYSTFRHTLHFGYLTSCGGLWSDVDCSLHLCLCLCLGFDCDPQVVLAYPWALHPRELSYSLFGILSPPELAQLVSAYTCASVGIS